ncbi:MAG: glycosyltransferase family 4 protein [Bacteroidota bacterium]
MNILITSEAAGIAGSTYSVSYLAGGLARRGHRVWVACPQDTLLWRLIEETPAQAIHVTFANKLHRKSIREIASIVREHSIEIINAQASKDRYITILAKALYKLPAKLIHTRRQMAKSLGMFGQSIFYQKGTNAIVAVSFGVKYSLQKLGISEQHIKVIYNGTPPQKYTNLSDAATSVLREKYQIGAQDMVIGCVARLKEQAQLLGALRYVDCPVHLVLVGIEETPELAAIRDQWAVPHQVHYAGSVNIQEVLHHYPLFTLNVLPSTIEGLSQSLLEAMALGVPVIATQMGGNSELIREGVNGLLFENGDEQQLAHYINQLLDTPELRESFAEAGRRTALEDFSLDRMLDQYEILFQELRRPKSG